MTYPTETNREDVPRRPPRQTPRRASGPLGGDGKERAADERRGAELRCSKTRALVVDDSPDVTEMLATMMRFAGYEVATALSAPEAFDAARREHFDVVVSDIGMPGMNGYQLAEALRELPEYAHTPLVAVTGFSMYDDRERARASGFDGFLTKPIRPSDLLDIVKRLCG
ncbi:MAG: response regulator [Acidobacteriota bacterium]|nr:response regulator [Acidobacteriota bacterium]MDQ5837092.1 response regulator [Acidobacteriota bacterium]